MQKDKKHLSQHPHKELDCVITLLERNVKKTEL